MKDELGNRMKEFYENRYRFYLTRRTPVIIRIDGVSFHNFTKGLEKPFDLNFMDIMVKTCKSLCENIQGCVGGYTQSDEISLLLIDFFNLNSGAWYDYNIQKISSVSAAEATVFFNKALAEKLQELKEKLYNALNNCEEELARTYMRQVLILEKKENSAFFDSRVFNLPQNEVCNYFIWRQKDATRNSINSFGQHYYSHKELMGKKQTEVQEMLFQKGINWNDYDVPIKRGSFIKKDLDNWIIDNNIPIFTQDRAYIDNLFEK